MQHWRARILTAVVWTLAVLSSVAYAAGVGAAIEIGDWEIVAFDTGALAAAWALALLSRLPYGVRASGVLLVAYVVGAYFTTRFGPFAAGPYWLFSVPLLAAMLFGLRAAIGLVALVAATVATLGVLLAHAAVPWADRMELHAWVVICASLISLDALLSIGIAVLLGRLAAMHEEVQHEVKQREKTERMLVHAQKMEGVGRLAGGVAHDFNNLLTAMSSFTEFARDELDESQTAYEDLGEVLAAVQRARTLTQQLLAFSRQQVVEPRVVDVNEVVSETERMLQRVLGEDIAFVTRLAPDLWSVHMDPHALEQVLMNLAVNARDAMPEGGKLMIETANTHLEEPPVDVGGSTMPQGDCVMLAVSDTGVGMDHETQANIFEPFFTTKPVGQGTGLGLASCYGIVRQAGGHIYVYSELGQGTTFRVYLPRARGRAESMQPPRAPVDLTGDETILVVEDDPRVRATLIRGLRRWGYEVLEAADGAEAHSVIRVRREQIDLLLTNVVMPDTTGKELADVLTRDRPDLRVLYVSGYTRDMVAHRGVVGSDVELLQKPFTTQELASKVRRVLDRAATSARPPQGE
ncbi:MAG: ATP-binding protein [Myxococcota bacterium]